MVLHLIEIFKFLKNNLIKIFLGTIFIAFTFILITSNPFSKNNNNERSVTNEQNNNSVSTAQPAVFYFFVENEDGTTFSNNLIIEQFLLTNDVLKEASVGRKIKLDEIIEKNGNTIDVNYNDTGKAKIIGINRNDTTQLMEFSVNVGNKNENLKIAEFFYNFIFNGKIPFFVNKKVYSFKEPTLLEIDVKFDILSAEPPVEENNILLNVAIGVMMGFVISFFILFFSYFFSNNLIYSFSYFIENTDLFFLIDKKTNYNEELLYYLKQTKNNSIIIFEKPIIHYGNSDDKVCKAIDTMRSVRNFTDIDDPNSISRVFYIIEEGKTSRAWYKTQRRIDQNYNLPTSVIQINKK